MSVPQSITDALNTVQADADDVSAKKAAKAQTTAALSNAQVADTNAAHDLTASEGKLGTDLQALIALEQQTYGAAPTPPAPTP